MARSVDLGEALAQWQAAIVPDPTLTGGDRLCRLIGAVDSAMRRRGDRLDPTVRAAVVAAAHATLAGPREFEGYNELLDRGWKRASVDRAVCELAVRLRGSAAALAPELKVIAPVRSWAMGRDEEIAYARKHGIPVKGGTETAPYSIDDNLWGRSSEGKWIEDLSHAPDDDVFQLVTRPEEAPDEPETIEDVYEPYLLQQGFLKRTPRGRCATVHAFRHLGLEPPSQPLF